MYTTNNVHEVCHSQLLYGSWEQEAQFHQAGKEIKRRTQDTDKVALWGMRKFGSVLPYGTQWTSRVKQECWLGNLVLFLSQDTGSVLIPTDIKYYQEFGGEKVAFEKEEVDEIRRFGKPGEWREYCIDSVRAIPCLCMSVCVHFLLSPLISKAWRYWDLSQRAGWSSTITSNQLTSSTQMRQLVVMCVCGGGYSGGLHVVLLLCRW